MGGEGEKGKSWPNRVGFETPVGVGGRGWLNPPRQFIIAAG